MTMIMHKYLFKNLQGFKFIAFVQYLVHRTTPKTVSLWTIVNKKWKWRYGE